jgi:opacity protein-like surface antigen
MSKLRYRFARSNLVKKVEKGVSIIESPASPSSSGPLGTSSTFGPRSTSVGVPRFVPLAVGLACLATLGASQATAQQMMEPKVGFFAQGEVGYQSREYAGENGITNLTFDDDWYWGLGIGWRYNKNFRFSVEYSQMTNDVDQIRPGVPIPVEDPILGVIGVDGAQFPAVGDVTLTSWTVNVYYDVDGFGDQNRFRPYVGFGVGMQESEISGLAPAFFSDIGVDRRLNASDTSPVLTFEGGLTYMLSPQTEFYGGLKYSYVSSFLFEDTAFGTLMPNGSRSWIFKGGLRYTF